jgi:hypothetical protein
MPYTKKRKTSKPKLTPTEKFEKTIIPNLKSKARQWDFRSMESEIVENQLLFGTNYQQLSLEEKTEQYNIMSTFNSDNIVLTNVARFFLAKLLISLRSDYQKSGLSLENFYEFKFNLQIRKVEKYIIFHQLLCNWPTIGVSCISYIS